MKKCLNCNKEITHNPENKYCNSDCFNEHKYNENVRKWFDGELSGHKSDFTVSSYVKKFLLEFNNYSCESCGFNKNSYLRTISRLESPHFCGICTNYREIHRIRSSRKILL